MRFQKSEKSKTVRGAWLRRATNHIELSEKVSSFSIRDFSSAVHKLQEAGRENVLIDFSQVINAYPDGMLPLIATIDRLRSEGFTIKVRLPNYRDTRRLFRKVDWAHYLAPDQYERSESKHDRHLVTRRFTDAQEQTAAVNDFMDVIIRNMVLPRNLIAGLEWSINEITDNVLNHSNSDCGGFIQANTYPRNRRIAFAVADSGIGILNSLREGIPTLRTDVQAIGEAVKAGVTRNPEVGQGNGLAGSLRISTATGGSFEITSGAGRMLISSRGTTHNDRYEDQTYRGTLVCGHVNTDTDFSLNDALDFGDGIVRSPVDFIETQYELPDRDCLFIAMRKETTGFGTRHSGGQIRSKVINLLEAEPHLPIIIDWEGVPVISSSFADEMVGKLFLQLGALGFSARIRNIGMDDLIRKLLDKAVAQRLVQASDADV